MRLHGLTAHVQHHLLSTKLLYLSQLKPYGVLNVVSEEAFQKSSGLALRFI